MQDIAKQEAAAMIPTKLYLIQVEVKALYSAMLELLPDVEIFQNEVGTVKPFLSFAKDHQQSAMEQILIKLRIGNSKISQMKMRIWGIRNDFKMLLTQGYDNEEGKTYTSAPAAVEFENDTVVPEDEQRTATSIETFEVARPPKDTEQQASEPVHHEDDVEVTEQNEPLYNLSSTSQYSHSPTKKCRICGEKINSRYYHMRKYHPGQKCFPCKLCEEGFDDFKKFTNHIKAHEGSPLLKCDLCNRVLASRTGMVEHMKTHNGEKPYTCTVCGKSFRFKVKLTTCTHGQGSAKDFDLLKDQSSFQCKLCRQHFATMHAIEKSRREHSNPDTDTLANATVKDGKQPCRHIEIQQVFHCNICTKSFNSVPQLKYHLNIHFGIKLYKCETCGEKFFTSTDKKKHMYEKHGGEYPGYKCKICNKMCRSVLGREAHYLKHTLEERNAHNVVIKMAECDICGKTVRRNVLPTHRLVHASRDSFICEVCGWCFKRKAQLNQHVRVHMDPNDRPLAKHSAFQPKRQEKRIKLADKTFKCDICSKYLSSQQSLQRHEIVHTKVKAFKCNLCGLSFALYGNLKRHSSVHTGQKQFQCDFCGKGFAQKNGLEVHRRVHTGEKPYQCNHCGKRFSDPSTLYKHKAKHEKDVSLFKQFKQEANVGNPMGIM